MTVTRLLGLVALALTVAIAVTSDPGTINEPALVIVTFFVLSVAVIL